MSGFIGAFSASVFLLLASPLSHAYVDAHYQQYVDTRVCTGCDLSGAIFMDITNTSGQLQNSNLSRANFVMSNLANTNFSGALLSNAQLMHVNFAGSNFSGANLTAANLMGASLANAELSNARFFGANLSEANLYGSGFSKKQQEAAASVCHALMPDATRGPC